jgi:glc operon protein GlcG
MAVSLGAAQQMVNAGLEEAQRRGATVSIAVVDAAGYLIASARMDGALLHATDLAQGKANAAVLYRRATSEFQWPSAPLEATITRLGGRFIPAPGAVPIRQGNQVIGAVGVAGSKSDDETIASAAIEGYSTTP